MADKLNTVRYIDGGTGPQPGNIPVFQDEFANVADSGYSVTALLGAIGVTGIQGVTGLRGPTGIFGPTGIQGETGILGATGLRGPTGYIGVTGVTGLSGFTGPQGQAADVMRFRGVISEDADWPSTALNGDFYTITSPTAVSQYGYTFFQGEEVVWRSDTGLPYDGEWILVGTRPDLIQGHTGITGFTGDAGITGLAGSTGIQGPTGWQGGTGPQGLTGPQGSGVPLYTEVISSWTTGTQGYYYADVQHDLGSEDMLVQGWENITDQQLDFGAVEIISSNVVRVYVTDPTLTSKIVIKT